MSRNIFAKTLIAIFALSIAVASPAAAENPGAAPGVYEFHPRDQHYYYDGPHGILTGDAIYESDSPKGGTRVVWSLRLSWNVRALITSPMTCRTKVDNLKGYSDHHPDIPADYYLHSTIKGVQLEKWYTLRVSCDFTAVKAGQTAPGNVSYQFRFVLHEK